MNRYIINLNGRYPARVRFVAKRQFPPFYEKAIPIALVVIGILILVLFGVIIYVLGFAG